MATNPTRRTILAAAAAPAALAVPSIAQAAPEDPAVAAVLAYVAADEAEKAYSTPDGIDWSDDPGAQAIDAEVDRTYWALTEVQPTTMAGLALLVQAYGHGHLVNFGCRAFWDPFNPDCSDWCDGRDIALLTAIVRAGRAET